MQNKTIFISAGGTGGHVFPALILSEKLHKSGYKLYFITDKRGVKFIQNKDIGDIFQSILIIPASGFVGKNLFEKILSFLNVTVGFFKSILFVLKYNPKLTIGFGGYTTIPIVIASKILLKKTIIHSADTVFGLSNKILSFFADSICTSFSRVLNIPKMAKRKVVFTALPILEDFYKFGNIPYTINDKKINILITGGSLGANALSVPVATAISNLPINIKKKLCIFHQVNEASINKVKKIYRKNNIDASVEIFFKNTPVLLYKCHLFIGRSGASTVYEVMTVKRPSIFIPLQHKDRHQIINAELLEQIGASIIILQNDEFIDTLTNVLSAILSDLSKLKQMQETLKHVRTGEAVSILSELINTYMG